MTAHVHTRFFVWLALCVLAPCARAQTAHWEPRSGSLALNQVSEIQLVFENCEPEGEPALPATQGLELARNGSQSQNMSIENGTYKKVFIYGYNVRPTLLARVSIPRFQVKTDKGNVAVAAAVYDVGKSASVGGSVPLDSIAKSHFNAPTEVWAGEVFPLSYELNVVRRYFAQAGDLTWNSGNLAIEDWPKQQIQERLVNGEKQISVYANTRALAPKPGTVTLAQGTQLVALVTGSQTFGFFSSPSLEQFTITTEKSDIQVKPLPPQAPKGFSGAVGKFTLTSKVVPDHAQVGDPITWTLTLEGTGNWPDINALPAREVSADFRTVQPQPKRTPKQGKLFDATLSEDVILIPTVSGDYVLGPVLWSYFDPEKGEYITLTAPSHSVHIEPASAARAPGTPTPGASSRPGLTPAPPPPAPPAPVPGDVAQTSSGNQSPFTKGSLWVVAFSPTLGLLLLWVGLATGRALKGDPHRAARKARKNLPAMIASVEAAASIEAKKEALRHWQQEVASLHAISHATPASAHFPATSQFPTLWNEVERFLYGTAKDLPSDWAERATQAAQETSVPPFSLLSVFARRHLLPFLVLALAVALVPQAHASLQTEAARHYAKGEFAEAAELWRSATDAQPSLWVNHYNLSLALAQKDQWQEAAAHAAIAFAQNPGEPSVRQQLDLTLPKAGFTPMVLGELRLHSWTNDAVTLLSAAGWQRAILAATLCLASALALLLLRAYRVVGRWSGFSAALLGAAGALLLLPSLYSIHRYGPLANPAAVITWQSGTLRSVPTDADTEQKTSALPPGTVALVDRSFLSWVHITFPGGQSGWVHREGVVPVWKNP